MTIMVERHKPRLFADKSISHRCVLPDPYDRLAKFAERRLGRVNSLSNMSVTFTTTLRQAKTKNATGISVPPEAVEELGGGKAPLVKATVNGYVYRGKVAVYGGECLMGFSAEHRVASGVKPGDVIEVTLELDLEPRTVEVPEDLQVALETVNKTEAFERAGPLERRSLCGRSKRPRRRRRVSAESRRS